MTTCMVTLVCGPEAAKHFCILHRTDEVTTSTGASVVFFFLVKEEFNCTWKRIFNFAYYNYTEALRGM